MAVYLSPVGNGQVLDSNGVPLVGGYWEAFLAGTTTPRTTYTSSTGLTAQPAQITLDASGRPANPIWLTGGVPVKFRLSNASAEVLLTLDNISGINDPSAVTTTNEWIVYSGTPTYIGATSFSVPGDQTATFQVGRRVKTANTGGTRYGTIVSVAFSSVTTVTIESDSGSLDSGLSEVSYGILSAVNSAYPLGPSFSAYNNALVTAVAATVFVKVLYDTELWDKGSCFASSRFTPTVPGIYQINAGHENSANANGFVCIYKNGVEYKRGNWVNTGSTWRGMSVSAQVSMNGTTDYVEIYTYQDSGGPLTTATGSQYTWVDGHFVRGL
jgi:hypothetical protein